MTEDSLEAGNRRANPHLRNTNLHDFDIFVFGRRRISGLLTVAISKLIKLTDLFSLVLFGDSFPRNQSKAGFMIRVTNHRGFEF